MIGKTTISEVWFKTALKLLKNEIFANGLQKSGKLKLSCS